MQKTMILVMTTARLEAASVTHQKCLPSYKGL